MAAEPTSETTPALAIEHLCAQYGSAAALHDISLPIPTRQVFAILGPSGGGKTTLLKALNRTLELTPGARVTAGKVVFSGENIYAPNTDLLALRRQIGIVSQKPLIFPMSIQENVLFGVRFHRSEPGRPPREIAEEFLRMAALWDEVKERLNEPATRLSVGQQQRLCIARTLANRPQILLMDEPCSALDPQSTQRIETLLAELKKKYTIVIVTHNFAQARRVSEQACFLANGRLLEYGPTHPLFEHPADATVRDFVTGKVG